MDSRPVAGHTSHAIGRMGRGPRTGTRMWLLLCRIGRQFLKLCHFDEPATGLSVGVRRKLMHHAKRIGQQYKFSLRPKSLPVQLIEMT